MSSSSMGNSVVVVMDIRDTFITFTWILCDRMPMIILVDNLCLAIIFRVENHGLSELGIQDRLET